MEPLTFGAFCSASFLEWLKISIVRSLSGNLVLNQKNSMRGENRLCFFVLEQAAHLTIQPVKVCSDV